MVDEVPAELTWIYPGQLPLRPGMTLPERVPDALSL
jgi:hypothetical protein